MKLLLAFVLGAVCVYALRRKPEVVKWDATSPLWLWSEGRETWTWRDLERVDAV